MQSAVVVVPRNFRLRLGDMRAARWLVPHWRCFALPLAVRRNRFFVPLWVFILGITRSGSMQADFDFGKPQTIPESAVRVKGDAPMMRSVRQASAVRRAASEAEGG